MSTGWRRRRIRRGVWAALLLLTGGGTVWIVIVDGWTRAAVATAISMVVTALGLALDLASHLRGAEDRGPTVGALADDLARTVEEQWLEEATARELRSPKTLPLTWAATEREVGDDPMAVV